MPPTLANGKICYVELPAANGRIGGFLLEGLRLECPDAGNGAQAFDDTTGEVSGAFVSGRKPWPAPGLLFYIMVDSVAAACDKVEAAGGKIIQRIGVDAPEITARFQDPAGNIIGLYQEPSGTTGLMRVCNTAIDCRL